MADKNRPRGTWRAFLGRQDSADDAGGASERQIGLAVKQKIRV